MASNLSTKTPINKTVADPSLADLLNLWKKGTMLDLNCHALATVQSFDPTNQTVTATVNYKKTFQQRQPDGTYVAVLRDYPLLIDCPAIILQGGAGALTFPIAQGDSCLILFNDRDMDNWLHGGQVMEPATQRLHSFSDGIALVGLRSFNRALADYDSERVVLKNDEASIAIGAELIQISNDAQNLADILQDLITAIKGLKVDLSGVTVGSGSVPLGGTVNALSLTQLTQIASDLEEILE